MGSTSNSRRTCFGLSPARSIRQRRSFVRRTTLCETLETRALLTATPADAENALPETAFPHQQSMACGCAGCQVPPPPAIEMLAAAQPAVAPFPLTETFKLHSVASATKRIYLDFDGHLTSGTAWQGGATFNTPAFSLDTDYANFSDAEMQAIQEVWMRVAEDFSPFHVDVTTEEPSVDDLRQAGAGDERWGIRVVIGGNGAWRAGAAGVAFLNSFNWNSDTPCFVFADQWWKTNRNMMATIASHEVGHTLGLRHDGYGGSEYYSGRGTGATSWGPLMGNPGYMSVTQWSKGDYGGATNTEDDLDIISRNNGFDYRVDDHGDTAEAATVRPGAEFTVAGVIERNTDIDMFRVESTGTLRARVTPLAVGANLDVLAELRDALGTVIATSNPLEALTASFSLTVTPGTYYLAIRGAGAGNPATTGYSNYGSLGQYTLTVGGPAEPVPVASLAPVTVTEGDVGTAIANVVVSLSAAAANDVTVRYETVAGTAASSTDFIAAGGTVRIPAGQTKVTIPVAIVGDRVVEQAETFSVRIASIEGATGVGAAATVTVQDNDVNSGPAVSIANASLAEGHFGTPVMRFNVTLAAASKVQTSVSYLTANGTAIAGEDYFAASGSVTFQPGQISKTIDVRLAGDTRVEQDETFTITLRNPVGLTLGAATATGTIVNDDSSTPTPPVPPTPPAPPPPTAGAAGFQITVTFPDSTLTTTQQLVFQQAAARWSQIIIADLPDVTFQGRLIDDLEIAATGPLIDGAGGILGGAGPRALRQSGSRLPYLGEMAFDSADLARMENDGTLLGVILHEMGHVIGIGSLWQSRNLVTGIGTANPVYVGPKAVAAYASIFGISAKSIPVENTGGEGTAGGHWRETVFDTELMTGYAERPGVKMPISRITVGALEDLGYTVSYGAADSYTKPAPGAPVAAPTVVAPAPVVIASLASAAAVEGNAATKLHDVVVRLATPATSAVTIQYTAGAAAAANGRASATPGKDFVAESGVIVIPAGQTEGRIAVQVLGDSVHEPGSEHFRVWVSAAVGATFAPTWIDVDISDDDPAVAANAVAAAATQSSGGIAPGSPTAPANRPAPSPAAGLQPPAAPPAPPATATAVGGRVPQIGNPAAARLAAIGGTAKPSAPTAPAAGGVPSAAARNAALARLGGRVG
jgi:hypothetical protein